MKNKLILCLVLGTIMSGLSAQNLLNLDGWTIGTGSTTGFSQNGSTSENTREWGIGPHGQRAVLWKASPDASSDPDGGFNTSYISIDHTKMYRLVVWVKKTNSTNGGTYLGTNGGGSAVTSLSGTPNGNPYFWANDLPVLDRWYLLVGFVHGSGDNSMTNYGGIYDGTTGEKSLTINDFKFHISTTSLRLRSYLYYDTNTSDRQYFYAPRIDEVNGNEPSITELLGIGLHNLDQLSVGTDDLPSGYKLSVGGDPIMEKVKVQVESAWPDYVFDKNYPLKSVEELKRFIAQNGHLPGLPSAEEVEASNQDLGLIQQKLLEKIEELTLYTIAQEKKLKELTDLNTENKVLKSKYAILNTQYSLLSTQYKALLARIEKLESASNDNK
ncbi:hypothetical protein [Roseivirga sp. E12]|uniref:hypothetical protein n=1 Tax=Roseivirga sp. E12 TaxID=2819237 RepID=UPI001ABC1972|nr:hypothetical protein [Roseivirga sp. E12]MBO3699527.1 hypothetical protein [Roseivirga sp. E12]